MTIFKCKMCGGDLNVTENMTICECEYCGTKQTLPKNNNEAIANLFIRANRLRIHSEFDKAEEIYEKIINLDDKEAEAHWGMVLCKYGIEYIEDPATFERIPTCHRASYEAVTEDCDYLATIENADYNSREIYEFEAKRIEEIQKRILEKVKNENPFDVFICYKESDENGDRTEDSVIAQNIYDVLTAKGLKVFFARITLEDKLGQEYEPYIFSALNTAKVMLAVGTKPEYVNAVWVRNEWTRYLKLLKKDDSKVLIPVYANMDPYDFPEAFSHLQAQNIAKIGAMQDLVRGIEKIINFGKADILPSSGANNEKLIEEAFALLQDGSFSSAARKCDEILQSDPKNYDAYLGKMMADLKIKQLIAKNLIFRKYKSNENYIKAMECKDEASESIFDKAERKTKFLKKIYVVSICAICVCLAVILFNNKIIPEIKYHKAETLMESKKYYEAENAFRKLNGYKDSYKNAEKSRFNYLMSNIKNANIGDYVVFGVYEQDNNIENGKEDIEWLVLDENDGKKLLISKYALDCQKYKTVYSDVTWETCELRKWLNNDFISSAFSADEMTIIPTVTVSAEKNPTYSTKPGNATRDQVFLLSLTEADKYFTSNSTRECKPTAYAVANGASERYNDNCRWWLRSPGSNRTRATCVNDVGDVFEFGDFVNSANRAVRPALWIEIG